MDAISYVRILAGRWRIIALTCFVGLLAGWITTPGADGSGGGFTATHILRVDTPAEDATEGVRGQAASDIGLTALLATGTEVVSRVATELDTDAVALLESVSTATDAGLGTLSITARHPEAQRAAEIANTFAAELLEVLTERAQERYVVDLDKAEADLAQLQASVDELPPISATGRVDVDNAERAALLERFTAAGLRVQELQAQGEPSAGFTTLQEATPQPAGAGGANRSSTREPDSGRRADGSSGGDAAPSPAQNADTAPDPVTRMLIGGAVGLLLGIGLALLRERLDPRIRTREDAERAFGLPVLAEVPQLGREHRHRPEIATVDNGRALEAEAYRVLATSLLFQHSSAMAADGAAIRNGQRDDHGPPALIETGDDVRRATNGLPLLGRVPLPASGSVLAHRIQPSSPAVEAYRWLGIPLGRADHNGSARMLMVTSATAGEETTATAANLGVALARDGQRVVVIDGDLHQPRLHTFFDLPNTVGLTSVVSGEVSISVASQPVTGEAGLSIVSAGPLPADSHELLASPRVGEVLTALAGTVDVVILKAAPVLATNDSSALAGATDGTVLVATGGATSGADLRRTVDILERVGATLLGVVLNEPARDRRPGDHNGAIPSLARTSGGDVVLVTSPGAKEGKSSASVNLAAALAEAGKSVLALDFDLRRPRLHQFFGEEPHQRGLTDALALSGGGPRLEDVIRSTTVHEVRVALSGSEVTNPSELLPGARHLVAEARGVAEVILIDTPPVLVASDAVQLIPAADAVVVVCRTGTTRSTEAARARQLLARLDAPVLGLVLLGVQPSSGARSYYYDYTNRQRHFWSRSRSRHAAPRSTRRQDDGGRTIVPPAAGGKATTTPTATAKKPGATKVGQGPARSSGGKKAKQRSSSK